MKNIHINDSYKIWSPSKMQLIINEECFKQFDSCLPEIELRRSYAILYVEWWLHNIGYYVTKPFCSIEAIRLINLRCKDVDLEEW